MFYNYLKFVSLLVSFIKTSNNDYLKSHPSVFVRTVYDNLKTSIVFA